MIGMMLALGLMASEPGTKTVAPAIVPGLQAAEKPKPKDTDKVCWSEKPVGSHIMTTMCSTRVQLELQQRQDQEGLKSGRFTGKYQSRMTN